MDTKKMFINLDDLERCSLWWMDSHDDSFHEAYNPENFPEEVRSQDLIIKANFTTPKNKKFKGYLIGCENIFTIGLFVKDKVFVFNKNLPDLCLKYFHEISRLLSWDGLCKPGDMFPIHYESDLGYENATSFIGEFDAFEKIKEDRADRWKKI